LLNGDEWVTAATLTVLWEDAQAASGDYEPVDHTDLQSVELDFAAKSSAEGFNHASFQNRTGVRQDDLNDDDENGNCEYDRGNGPTPGFRYAYTRRLSGVLKLDRVSVPAPDAIYWMRRGIALLSECCNAWS